MYTHLSNTENIERLCHIKKMFNPLPDMPILGSSNSAANKDMMSKIWTHGDKII